MSKPKFTPEEALAFHLEPTPGKFEITATVPMTTQRDLSLAYSPGVAVPCEAIAANPETAYDYTNKGTLLYVGATKNLKRRLSEHRVSSAWFDEMVDIEVVEFDNVDDAADLEINSIQTLQPKYNVQGKIKAARRYREARIVQEDYSFLHLDSSASSMLFGHMAKVLSQFTDDELEEIARDAAHCAAKIRADRVQTVEI